MCYAFACELFCDDCTELLKRDLDSNGCEDTGDTNDYPQYAGNSESDVPEVCAECGEWLGNPLTADGIVCLVDMVYDREMYDLDCIDLRRIYNWVDFREISSCYACERAVEESELDDWGYCDECAAASEESEFDDDEEYDDGV